MEARSYSTVPSGIGGPHWHHGTGVYRSRSEALLAGQNRALELVASNVPLDEVLKYLTRFIESQAEGLVCSILVVEGLRLRLRAAPSLPEAYNRLVDGLPIGPAVGSCGTAAFTGRCASADDIATDPRWVQFPAIVRNALAHGLRACWSTPIRGSSGAVLGTFAIYYRSPTGPRASDSALVDMATHVAGIAIERHNVDCALAERAQRLADSNRSDRRKDAFLALLAHELRNPLAPIVSALSLMATHESNLAAMRRYRAMIERQVRQLSRLVDDLLDVSRITRDKISLHKQRIPFGDALWCAIEASRPLLEERRHSLTVRLSSEPMLLDADPVRLAQVLANLVNNAAKYTDPGGHIEVCAERAGSEIACSVRDDGIGIPADIIERIFDMFVQADGSSAKAKGGLGIGLTLVKRLVELHGGRVEATSGGPGCGTQVTLRLPAAPCGEVLRPAPGPNRASAPLQASARRVLVVDDNCDAAESLADALRDAGHAVRVVTDGQGALSAAESWSPQVVLLDIGMPGMDGYEVARRLRAAHGSGELRLVAVTAYGQEADVRRAQSAGFDAHLVKPADMDRVRAAVAGEDKQQSDERLETTRSPASPGVQGLHRSSPGSALSGRSGT